MSASIGNFRDLVRKAHVGELKLPGFQRNWRWRPDKVVKLYDSLRLRYPIGSFLFLAGSGENLAPRTFTGSVSGASDVTTDFLVLDGQQRLTSGIHIFHATGPRQYYLDIEKLNSLVVDSEIDIEDENAVSDFCKNIDFEDGYIKVKHPDPDPRSLLVKSDLVCTSILTNSTQFNIAALAYIQARPERADLMMRVVQPHFSLSDNDSVPHINIDEKTSISAISRIFTTLNTTGQMLTPFELVVASLFPAKIDLQKEVSDFREQGTYYPYMDGTGEILLQTIAMLADVDQKKSNLPKSINPMNYTQHKAAAFKALEELGAFLTDNLGCGLNATGQLVPYDAIYAPMARALMHVQNKGLPGPDLAEAHRKLRLWFAASALTQRYQEGVHNKQTRDFREIVSWIDGGSRPAWIDEARTPSLSGRDFEGAIGKFIQCCVNQNDPRDPVVVAHKVGFRSGAMTTEKHHVFPSRYVQHLAGWDKKTDKANHLLNMMFVERETNKRWLNHDPRDHINEALKAIDETDLRRRYRDQFIPDAAFDILKNPSKGREDLYEFMSHRQTYIQSWVNNTFGIAPLSQNDASYSEELGAEDEMVLSADEP